MKYWCRNCEEFSVVKCDQEGCKYRGYYQCNNGCVGVSRIHGGMHHPERSAKEQFLDLDKVLPDEDGDTEPPEAPRDHLYWDEETEAFVKFEQLTEEGKLAAAIAKNFGNDDELREWLVERISNKIQNG